MYWWRLSPWYLAILSSATTIISMCLSCENDLLYLFLSFLSPWVAFELEVKSTWFWTIKFFDWFSTNENKERKSHKILVGKCNVI